MAKARRPSDIPLDVRVDLEDLPSDQEWPRLAAFAFDRRGTLLARQPLERDPKKKTVGRARLEISEPGVVVKIGPDVEEPPSDRLRPVTASVQLDREGTNRLTMSVSEVQWGFWLKCPYVVTGTVEKWADGHSEPICSGEVEIFDVDVGYCLLKLPEPVLERIRDGLIDIVLDPPHPRLSASPLWSEWKEDDWRSVTFRGTLATGETEIKRRLEDLPPEWSFASQRFAAMSSARERVAAVMVKMDTAKRREWLASEAVEGIQVSKLLYTSTRQFRELLIERFQAVRYWICWYPWIYWLWWPYCYWYSLEKLGTASLQPDGSFSKTVWLACGRKDTPDLWFVVRQKVNGVERVIFARHPVPCNTYWNHPSGDPVTLVVTDPEAVSCHQDPATDLDPTHLWVVPLAIGNYSLQRIYGTGAGSLPADAAKIGLYESISTGLSAAALQTFHDGPFGGRLGVRLLFSRALETAGVKYYRIRRRWNGAGSWSSLDQEVVRHYSQYDPATGSLEFKPYHLGPQTVGVEETLFEIPPADPPNKATDPTAAWYVINATVDLMNGYLNSTAANGYVELKLELFDSAGTRIDPASFGGGIPFYLPANNDIWSTITTADPATVNPDLVKADPEGGGFQVFVFRLQIDNRQPTAIIDPPQVLPSGATTDPCGMIRYLATDTAATLGYQARHPKKFAMYRFRLFRSTTLIHTEYGQVGDLGPSGAFTAGITSLADLLDTCPDAAFSENLYIWNMAFNGWNRVGPDASAVRAFALARAISATPVVMAAGRVEGT